MKPKKVKWVVDLKGGAQLALALNKYIVNKYNINNINK